MDAQREKLKLDSTVAELFAAYTEEATDGLKAAAARFGKGEFGYAESDLNDAKDALKRLDALNAALLADKFYDD